MIITHRDKPHIRALFTFFNDCLFPRRTARDNDGDGEGDGDGDRDADLDDFERVMQDLDGDDEEQNEDD